MCVMAGVKEDFNEENEFEITKKLRNLFHINSRRLIESSIRLSMKKLIFIM